MGNFSYSDRSDASANARQPLASPSGRGVIGAAAHNAGQIAVAVTVTRTIGLWAYLPVLLISGMIAGLFTGFCAQALVNRMGAFPQDR